MNSKPIIVLFLGFFISFFWTASSQASLFNPYPPKDRFSSKVVWYNEGFVGPQKIGDKAECQVNGVLFGWSCVKEPREYANNYYVACEGTRGNESYWLLAATGVEFKFKNTSNDMIIIRWRDSCINVNEFSGIPFLGGMKYADTNTAATPDTFIPPKQTVVKQVYIPRLQHLYRGNILFGYEDYFDIDGEPIPKGQTVSFTLSLKVIDTSEKGSYYTVSCPPIGVKE